MCAKYFDLHICTKHRLVLFTIYTLNTTIQDQILFTKYENVAIFFSSSNLLYNLYSKTHIRLCFGANRKKSGTYCGGRGGREGQNVPKIAILKHLLSKIRKFYLNNFFQQFSLQPMFETTYEAIFLKNQKKSGTYHVGGRGVKKCQKCHFWTS